MLRATQLGFQLRTCDGKVHTWDSAGTPPRIFPSSGPVAQSLEGWDGECLAPTGPAHGPMLCHMEMHGA